MYFFDIKQKDKKKKGSATLSKTLDNKHTEMVQHFRSLQDMLPTHKQELAALEEEHETLKRAEAATPDSDAEMFLKKKMLNIRIEEKKKYIERIENRYEENEYYMRVGHILFDYYAMFDTDPQARGHVARVEDVADKCDDNEGDVEIDGDEDGDIDGDGDEDGDIDGDVDGDAADAADAGDTGDVDALQTFERLANEDGGNGDGMGSIERLLGGASRTRATGGSVAPKPVARTVRKDADVVPTKKTAATAPARRAADIDNTTQKNIMFFFDVKCGNTQDSSKNNKKSVLHNKYMFEIQKYYSPEIKRTNQTLCPECGIERTMMVTEGIFVCQECCFMEKVIVDSERPSFREPPPEISYFAYKRINHFNEWLNQFQAKETSEIPGEVYDQIILELRKEKNLDLRNLKKSRVREILSKLKLNRYYEHVTHIIYKINGVPPPEIPTELEEILRNMFRTIQGPFMKVCPQISKKRKNFLSYSYVMYKFLELLGYDELKKQFPLLKCKEKLHKQDKIWQGICQELGWQYIPSI